MTLFIAGNILLGILFAFAVVVALDILSGIDRKTDSKILLIVVAITMAMIINRLREMSL